VVAKQHAHHRAAVGRVDPQGAHRSGKAQDVSDVGFRHGILVRLRAEGRPPRQQASVAHANAIGHHPQGVPPPAVKAGEGRSTVILVEGNGVHGAAEVQD
jgi:hypothetical protein